jgi:pimeloyl-ACP methyl ester carboxylesterase
VGIIKIALTALAGLGGVGVLVELLLRRRAPRAHPPPGELVDVGGRRLHLHRMGSGSPAVILEAGGGSSSPVWYAVQPVLAETATVCSYDRAGYAWSDPVRTPRDAIGMADELHALLAAASVPPPYVLVGHSLGGAVIMVFADRYPSDVAGLVFIDPSPPDLALLEEFGKPSVMDRMFGLGMRVAAATGALRLLLSRAAVPDMPPEIAAQVKAVGPRQIATIHQEMGLATKIVAQASAVGSFGSLPTIVLSAGRVPDGLRKGRHAERQQRMHELALKAHSDLARRSAVGQHRVIEDAEHFIQLEQPAAVIAAVVDVVNQTRDGRDPTGNAGFGDPDTSS